MTAKQEARLAALERRVGRIDATAKDAGHRLPPWNFQDDGSTLLAATRCEACGRDAAVRIEATRKDGLIEWEAGPLRYAPCSP